MTTVKEFTTLCKAGNISEAYQQAEAELQEAQSRLDQFQGSHEHKAYVWAQRGLGWVLYYTIKQAAEANDHPSLLAHLDELSQLDKLTGEGDALIFESVLWKVGAYVKTYLNPQHGDSLRKLSDLFARLRRYTFAPSEAFSYVLSCFIKFDGWPEMNAFIDWWGLDNLNPKDYAPYRNERGQEMMSLVEQVMIKKSKCLLLLHNRQLTEEFLPKLEAINEAHPEMTYVSYYYGKLLLSLGATQQEALAALLPFVRKKATEFWVWQLLAEVFTNDAEKKLACLLRATHCCTPEGFLVKVRAQLANAYIQGEHYAQAKAEIEKLTKTYQTEGWRIPREVEEWTKQPWYSSEVASGKATLNYERVTDDILCEGAEEAIAIVTHVDAKSQKATLVYGFKQRVVKKLRLRVGVGVALHIRFVAEGDGIRLLAIKEASFPTTGLSYAKIVSGTISKRENQGFAFLRVQAKEDYFIAPPVVQKYALADADSVKSLVVYDYDRKKEEWSWRCLSVKK